MLIGQPAHVHMLDRAFQYAPTINLIPRNGQDCERNIFCVFGIGLRARLSDSPSKTIEHLWKHKLSNKKPGSYSASKTIDTIRNHTTNNLRVRLSDCLSKTINNHWRQLFVEQTTPLRFARTRLTETSRCVVFMEFLKKLDLDPDRI